jgi:aspartyl-tRNA(Asn)/glutamyl-tRNA(Gln) amidotransferase subunit B
MFAKAINAKVNKTSIFNRKNYFYPDLPTGYQISQYEIPIVEGGYLTIEVDGKEKIINITRAHLENDAGKNMHHGSESRVDLNRAGTPLLEIVSEPELRSSDEAVAYLKKLHSIVRFLGISDANMQEGSFRCDVNVSIRPKGDDKFYTRCEIKNMNSFKFIEKAIKYEVNRHIEAWEDGIYDKEIVQETRLFDVKTGETRSMRGKEEAADYRYFPDPDLLPLIIDDEVIKKYSMIPEMPDEKKERFIKNFGIKPYDANVIVSSVEMSNYFEELINEGASPKLAVTWLTVELQGRLKEGLSVDKSPIKAKKLASLIKAIEKGVISNKAAKDVLDYLFEKDSSATIDEVIEKLGLKQVSDDSAIKAIIEEVIKNNPKQLQEYKAGKEKLFGFFVGQVMKASRGSANPQIVNKLLKEVLN